MPNRIFRIDPNAKSVEEIEAKTFADSGFLETKDMHEWLVSHPGLLGEDLLVIQREHVNVTNNLRRPDIIAVDTAGNLVIVEVKRDDAGRDIYWQAALYAASYWPRSADDIVEMFAAYKGSTTDEAQQILIDHTHTEDAKELEAKLNRKQRIILVAGTFPKEVTTTALWLNDQNLDISCLQLTTYYDPVSQSHFLQSSYIVPLPEAKEIMVEVRRVQRERSEVDALVDSRRTDAVSQFMFSVAEGLRVKLAPGLMPQKVSRWAGTWDSQRYFKLWYDRPPWQNHNFCFSAYLETGLGKQHKGDVWVSFEVSVTELTRAGIGEKTIAQLRDLADVRGQTGAFTAKQNVASFSVGQWVPASQLSTEESGAVVQELQILIEDLVPQIEDTLKAADAQENAAGVDVDGDQ